MRQALLSDYRSATAKRMDKQQFNSSRCLAAACASGVAGVLVFALLPVILGALDDSFQLDDLALGLTASSFYGSYALVTLTSALWIRRVNWRTATLAGVTAMITALLLPALVPSHGLVMLGFALAGFGAAVVFGISYAVIGDRDDKDRAFAIKLVPEQLVPALILIIVSTVAVEWLAFPRIFILLAMVVGSAGLITLGLPTRGTRAVEPRPRWDDFNPAILLALLAMIVYFAGFAGLWAFMERIASAGTLDADETGGLLALGLVTAALGSFIAALLGDRFGRLPPIMTGATVSTLGLLLLQGELSLLDFGLVMALVPTAWYFSLAYFFGVIADADHSGRLVGMTAFALAAGALAGPTLFGLVRNLGGSGSELAATCFVLGAVLITLAIRRI